MNILLLSNNAPNYFRFFNGIANKLIDDGHAVVCAVDSKFSEVANEIGSTGMVSHNFAEFFSSFPDDDVDFYLSKYQAYNLNAALLSDFERADVYGFGEGRDSQYYSRLKAALLCFFEQVISGSSVDVILYENVSNAFAFFAWIVGSSRGVEYIGLAASRLPGRFSIVTGPYSESQQYASIVNDVESRRLVVPPEVLEWSRDYIKGIDRITPDYMKYNKLDNTGLFDKYVNFEKLKKLRLAIKHVRDRHEYAFQVGNPLRLSVAMVSRSVARKLRLRSISKYYSKVDELYSAKDVFLLYPLHYHPESSTSVLAGTYLDEYEVIRNIAFNLPSGVSLYVKDHVSAYGFQSISFYKKIAALPNVKLVSPFENTKKLISLSAAVITLTSTVGYEALLLNKRVFLYGEVFYKFHPNVTPIKNPSELFRTFREFLFAPVLSVDAYNLSFVAAYHMGTYPGVLNLFLNQLQTNKLVNEIYPHLQEKLATSMATRLSNEI